MTQHTSNHGPAPLLRDFGPVLAQAGGPLLDLACGRGANGVHLATLGAQVVLADVSAEALEAARELARANDVAVTTWQVDLEAGGSPLPRDTYGGIIVFRYLHRPLFPCIKAALRPGGILAYETFTTAQVAYGKPTNPDFLLKPGELAQTFAGWEVLQSFEGLLHDGETPRAVAQMVCRKPLT